jgi:hypothetical protein
MEPPVQDAITGFGPVFFEGLPVPPEGVKTNATTAMKTAPAIQSFWFFRKIANGLDIGQINPWYSAFK